MRLDRFVAEASLLESGLLREVRGDDRVDVGDVTMDSRSVRPGSLFACVVGQYSDGHAFAGEALARGASSLLCERPFDADAPQVVVTSVRQALGPVASAFHGHPSRSLVVAGVTGTNGKTTTVAFLAAALQAAGLATTSIGTLTHLRTTPEAPELQALLAEWRDAGGRAIAMEVSSHALDQHRVDATVFAAGVFTNLTSEHLDYHHTMDAYFESKAALFEEGRTAVAVVNRADPWGQKLLDRLAGGTIPVETFSPDDATDLVLRPGGSRFTWAGETVSIQVGGRFNVANAVAAACCARALGVDVATIAGGLGAVEGVRGRFQVVEAGQPFTVLVDYAHTPDGLTKALRAARELTAGRLIVVFGAGGDRDHGKRPLMGAAVAELADLAVVTSDNPRTEDPEAIIDQVVAGAAGAANLVVESDRAAAISTAVATAEAGDVVVIAGKGHEQGQDLGGRLIPFDDVEVARSAVARILASRRDQA
ncbi:MAG: UDP-N-acetylmuramoyl-L-alanyl-D-glutamate--2,6-diaminopimelate ligase [Acidimicrobiales bacterium]